MSHFHTRGTVLLLQYLAQMPLDIPFTFTCVFKEFAFLMASLLEENSQWGSQHSLLMFSILRQMELCQSKCVVSTLCFCYKWCVNLKPTILFTYTLLTKRMTFHNSLKPNNMDFPQGNTLWCLDLKKKKPALFLWQLIWKFSTHLLLSLTKVSERVLILR